jgi:SH3-like domain-containing protein
MIMKIWKSLAFFCLIAFVDVSAQKTDLPIPRFASLRSAKVNLHVGPGLKYPVEWVLVYKNLPVLIVLEFGQWRKIKLFDGTIGWVHKSLLSSKKTKVSIKETTLFSKPSDRSKKVAIISPGVVLEEIKLQKTWIKVHVKTNKNQKLIGWIKTKYLWLGPK